MTKDNVTLASWLLNVAGCNVELASWRFRRCSFSVYRGWVKTLASLSKDELSKSLSRSKKMSFGSESGRSWASASVREVITSPGGDVFQRNGKGNDDETELKWAAIERLPTYDRLRKEILKQTLDDGNIVHQEVDVTNLGLQDESS